MKKLLLSALLICSATACKKKDEATKTESPPAATTEPAAQATPTPAAPAKEAVDICGKITTADIEAALGGKVTGEPQATPAQGSLLGQCDWQVDKSMASVSARPVNEFDATVAAAKDGKDVAGIGEKASASKLGYLVKLAGRPYMLQVMVMGIDGLDSTKTEALAKLAAEKL